MTDEDGMIGKPISFHLPPEVYLRLENAVTEREYEIIMQSYINEHWDEIIAMHTLANQEEEEE